MIVAVRGRAGTEAPLVSEMTTTSAVIAEIMEELSSKTQNERGEWTSESQVMQQQRWEAAWYLVISSFVPPKITPAAVADRWKRS